jgi:hypothetical protein
MGVAGPWTIWIIGVLFLAACAPSAAPSSSDGASVSPTHVAGDDQVCDPTATPFIAGPDGTQLVLGSGPIGMSEWASQDGDHAFLRQNGDCIWIVGYVPLGDDEPPFLTVFHGRIGTDLRVVGTFSDITGELVPGYNHGDAAFLVAFEGEDIVLVADRTETGPPGCFGGDGPCPEPLKLRRVAP